MSPAEMRLRLTRTIARAALILCASCASHAIDRTLARTQPAPIYTIRGLVRTSDESPAANAEVVATTWSPWRAERAICRAHTDESGRFILHSPGEDIDGWTLTVHADGYGASELSTGYFELGTLREFDIGVIYLYRPAALEGTVTDDRGAAVSFSRVFVDYQRFPGNWSVDPVGREFEGGHYQLSGLSAAPSRIRVEAPGYEIATQDKVLRTGETARADFTLSAAASESRPEAVQRLDRQFDQQFDSVGRLLIRATRAGGGPAPVIERIEFQFDHEDIGWARGGDRSEVLAPNLWRSAVPYMWLYHTVRILVIEPSGDAAECERVSVPAAGAEVELSAEFPACGSIRGHVTSETGDPIANARVQLRTESGSRGHWRVSDGDGYVQFDDLPPISASLACNDPEWSVPATLLEIRSNEIQAIELTARRRARVFGRILDNGRALRRSPLVAIYRGDPAAAPTAANPMNGILDIVGIVSADADGNYSIDGIGPGPVIVVPSEAPAPDGCATQQFSRPIPHIFDAWSGVAAPWPWIVDLSPGTEARVDCDLATSRRSPAR